MIGHFSLESPYIVRKQAVKQGKCDEGSHKASLNVFKCPNPKPIVSSISDDLNFRSTFGIVFKIRFIEEDLLRTWRESVCVLGGSFRGNY